MSKSEPIQLAGEATIIGELTAEEFEGASGRMPTIVVTTLSPPAGPVPVPYPNVDKAP